MEFVHRIHGTATDWRAKLYRILQQDQDAHRSLDRDTRRRWGDRYSDGTRRWYSRRPRPLKHVFWRLKSLITTGKATRTRGNAEQDPDHRKMVGVLKSLASTDEFPLPPRFN